MSHEINTFNGIPDRISKLIANSQQLASGLVIVPRDITTAAKLNGTSTRTLKEDTGNPHRLGQVASIVENHGMNAIGDGLVIDTTSLIEPFTPDTTSILDEIRHVPTEQLLTLHRYIGKLLTVRATGGDLIG